jgi:hypothetical protein
MTASMRNATLQIIRWALFTAALGWSIGFAAAGAEAQATKSNPYLAEPAPIPAPILAAKTAFIANAADESTPYIVKFTGSADAIYNSFYASMKASGRYQLVDSPAAADLIIEINYIGNPQIPALLDVHIMDVKTHSLLWTIREEVPGVFLTKTIHKNIQLTIDRIVTDISNLYFVPPPAQPTQPTTNP